MLIDKALLEAAADRALERVSIAGVQGLCVNIIKDALIFRAYTASDDPQIADEMEIAMNHMLADLSPVLESAHLQIVVWDNSITLDCRGVWIHVS